MRRIIIEEDDCKTIRLFNISDYMPILAKRDGKFVGMIVNEPGAGWILRLGGSFGATGHHPTLKDCLQSCINRNSSYEFFT